jgi:hypothetical protein
MNKRLASNKFILKNHPKYIDKLMGDSCLHFYKDGMLRAVDPYSGCKKLIRYAFLCMILLLFIYTFFLFFLQETL